MANTYNNQNLLQDSVVFGNFINCDVVSGGTKANAKFKRNVLIGGDLTLGTEISVTTSGGVTTYTDISGNIKFKINGVSYTITPTILSYLKDLTGDLQISLNSKAPFASPTFTGTPLATTPLTADNSTQIATTAFVKAQGYITTPPNLSSYAPLASPSFTGIPLAPTALTADNSTQIATTAFVKAQGYITTPPNLSSYAPLASPSFTGIPIAPTPAVGINTTQIATTAYVKSQLYATLASPSLTGVPIAPTPAVGINTTQIATTAYVKSQLYATLASPSLTGVPIAPTAIATTNTTQIATTAYVKSQNYLTNSSLTGDLTLGTTYANTLTVNSTSNFKNGFYSSSLSYMGITTEYDKWWGNQITFNGLNGITYDTPQFLPVPPTGRNTTITIINNTDGILYISPQPFGIFIYGQLTPLGSSINELTFGLYEFITINVGQAYDMWALKNITKNSPSVNLAYDQVISSVKTFSVLPLISATIPPNSNDNSIVTSFWVKQQGYMDLTSSQVSAGVKTFSDLPLISATIPPNSNDTSIVTSFWVKQQQQGYMDLTSSQVSAGVKTFSDLPLISATIPPNSNDTSIVTSFWVKQQGYVEGIDLDNYLLEWYLSKAEGASTYAPKASPTFSGTPLAPTPLTADNSTQIATTAFVKAQGYITTPPNLSSYAPLASPTFTGIPLAPTPAVGINTTQIATTAYVKSQLYATLASPTFSGIPLAPTPAVGINTTQIATTAYVKSQLYATLASPSFSGVPIAPTAIATTNTTQIATTAYVKSQGYLTSIDGYVDTTTDQSIAGIKSFSGSMSIGSSNLDTLTINSNATFESATVTTFNSVTAFNESASFTSNVILGNIDGSSLLTINGLLQKTIPLGTHTAQNNTPNAMFARIDVPNTSKTVTNIAPNISTVVNRASITLEAGAYMIYFSVPIGYTGTATFNYANISISPTTATLDANSQQSYGAYTFPTATTKFCSNIFLHVDILTTTTYYGTIQVFGAGTYTFVNTTLKMYAIRFA